MAAELGQLLAATRVVLHMHSDSLCRAPIIEEILLYPSLAIRKIFAACHGKSRENLRTLRSPFSMLYRQLEKSKTPAQLCLDPNQGSHDSHPHG